MSLNHKRFNVSSQISSLLPDHIQYDNKEINVFVEKFIEFLERENQSLYYLNTVSNHRDIDATDDHFIDRLQKELAVPIPRKYTANPRLLYKHLNDIYISRGTKDSIKNFFHILFNDNVEIYYPSDDILNVSDGNWFLKRNQEYDSTRVFQHLKASNENERSKTLNLSDSLPDAITVWHQSSYITLVTPANVALSGTLIEGSLRVPSLNDIENIQALQGETVDQLATRTQKYKDARENLLTTFVKTYISPGAKDVNYGQIGIVLNSNFKRDVVSNVGSSEKVSRIVKFSESSVVTYTEDNLIVLPKSTFYKLNRSDYSVQSRTVSRTSSEIQPFISFKDDVLRTTDSIHCIPNGNSLSNSGYLNNKKFIQDSYYWQKFSYVLRTGVDFETWASSYNRLIHPAGFKHFGEVLIAIFFTGEGPFNNVFQWLYGPKDVRSLELKDFTNYSEENRLDFVSTDFIHRDGRPLIGHPLYSFLAKNPEGLEFKYHLIDGLQREFPLIRINVPSVDVFHDPNLSNFTLLDLKFKKITTSSSRLITQSEYRELDLLNFIFLYEKNLGNVTHSHKTLIRDTDNYRTWVDETIVPGSLRIPTDEDINNSNSGVTQEMIDLGIQGIEFDIPTYRKNGLYDNNLTKFEKIIGEGKSLLTKIISAEFEIQQISEIIESLKLHTPTNLQSIKDELVLTRDNLPSYFNNIKNPAGYTDALSNITSKIDFLKALIVDEEATNDFQTKLETDLDNNNKNLETYISDFEIENVAFQSLWRFNHVGSNSFVKGVFGSTQTLTRREPSFVAFSNAFTRMLTIISLFKVSKLDIPDTGSIAYLSNSDPEDLTWDQAQLLTSLRDLNLTGEYNNLSKLSEWFLDEKVVEYNGPNGVSRPIYRYEAYLGVSLNQDLYLDLLRILAGIEPIPTTPTGFFTSIFTTPIDPNGPKSFSELISEAYNDERWKSLKTLHNLERIKTLTNTLNSDNRSEYELLYNEVGGLNQQELAVRGMLGRYDVINITPSARLRTYHSSLLVDLKPQSHTPDTVFGMGEYFERRKFQYKSGMYVWKDIVIESITSKKFGANIDSEVIQSPRHDSFHTNTYTFTSLYDPGTGSQQDPIDSHGYSIMAYRTLSGSDTAVALTFSYNGGPATERMASSDGMFLAGTWPPYNNLSHSTAFNDFSGTENAVEYKDYVFQFSLPDEVHHKIITQQADAYGDVLSVGHLNWSAGNGPSTADGRAQEVKVYFDRIYADSTIPTVTTELTEVPINWAGTFDNQHTDPSSLENRRWDWYYNPNDNCIYLAYETAYLLENRAVVLADYDEDIEYTTNRHNVGLYYHGLAGSEYQQNVDMLGTYRNFDGWLYGKNNVYKAAADHLDTTGNSFNIRITLNSNLHYDADGNLATELIGIDIELGADMTSWDTV
jgi:hypothetical protein